MQPIIYTLVTNEVSISIPQLMITAIELPSNAIVFMGTIFVDLQTHSCGYRHNCKVPWHDAKRKAVFHVFYWTRASQLPFYTTNWSSLLMPHLHFNCLGQMGSLEFFTALPDKIFCLGLSSHSWPSGKFVYACYARYTNSNALLWLRLSSIDVFCPHFVRAKNRPSGLKRLSSPRQILLIKKCR